MADRGGPAPLPPSIRDGLESELHDVPVEHRWKLRRLAEHLYVEGFREGHIVGGREAREDNRPSPTAG